MACNFFQRMAGNGSSSRRPPNATVASSASGIRSKSRDASNSDARPASRASFRGGRSVGPCYKIRITSRFLSGTDRRYSTVVSRSRSVVHGKAAKTRCEGIGSPVACCDLHTGR